MGRRRNWPGLAVTCHEIFDQSQTRINTLDQFIVAPQCEENNLDAQCYERTDERGENEPQGQLDIAFRRSGQVPDDHDIADNQGETACYTIVGQATQQKESKKQAAAYPEKVCCRSGSQKTRSDGYKKRSDQKRRHQKNCRTSGGNKVFAGKHKCRQSAHDTAWNAKSFDDNHGQRGRDNDACHNRAAAGIRRQLLFEEVEEPITEAFRVRKMN